MDNFELWYRANKGGERQISGEPPLTFNSNGKPITNWSITGSSGGVGERTANLVPPIATWERGYIDTYGNIRVPTATQEKYSSYIEVGSNRTYTFSSETGNFPNDGTGVWIGVGLFDENQQFIRRLAFKEDTGAMSIITTNETKYLILSFRTYGETLNTMLNVGNILPYEPYGYKIPVICGGRTTNIYLDTPLYEGEQITGTQTGVSIPTISGSNTLTIDTLVQPSSVSIAVRAGINKHLSDYLHYKYIVARRRGE